MREAAVPHLIATGQPDQLITMPAPLFRKTPRWTKDHLARIRTEMRRLGRDVESSEARLRLAVAKIFDAPHQA
jgi:hypothetical protein